MLVYASSGLLLAMVEYGELCLAGAAGQLHGSSLD